MGKKEIQVAAEMARVQWWAGGGIKMGKGEE